MSAGGVQPLPMMNVNTQQQQTPIPVQNMGLPMQHPPNVRQQSAASESSSHSNQQALLRNLHPEAQKLRNNQVRGVAESYRYGVLVLHGFLDSRPHVSKSQFSVKIANGPS